MKAAEYTKLTDKQQKYLHHLGLSKEAIRLYELLLVKGKLTAQLAADFTFDHPSAEYRLFYQLEAYELVRRLPSRPRQFEALKLQDGLQAAYIDQQHELKSLLKGAVKKMPISDEGSVIVGRQAVYERYVPLALQAKHEICIYSIGIAFSESLAETQRQVIRRGVRVRHIVQQKKASNYHVINKWLRLGVKLRYLQGPRGYHLTIIDHTHALVTFSDPTDTENRVTLENTNPAVVAIFIGQFNNLWSQAQVINT